MFQGQFTQITKRNGSCKSLPPVSSHADVQHFSFLSLNFVGLEWRHGSVNGRLFPVNFSLVNKSSPNASRNDWNVICARAITFSEKEKVIGCAGGSLKSVCSRSSTDVQRWAVKYFQHSGRSGYCDLKGLVRLIMEFYPFSALTTVVTFARYFRFSIAATENHLNVFGVVV